MGVDLDLESISEATSGAIGSLLSTTILYPLDTCKTRYQAEVRGNDQARYKNLSDVFWEAISTRQVLSLYQGLETKNLQSFIAQFVYFYGYSYFKRLYLETSGSKSIGTRANLILAAAAGACTAIVTQPLDTASSRMQTSAFGKSKGLLKTLAEGTWIDAFDGLGISLLLTANPAIQYTVFDQLKQRLLERKNKTGNGSSPVALSALAAFALGAVSKTVATVLTYPAIRCKVMIQAAEDDNEKTKNARPKSSKTIPGVLCAIWKKEGILGFFKGLHAQILKTVLSSALLLLLGFFYFQSEDESKGESGAPVNSCFWEWKPEFSVHYEKAGCETLGSLPVMFLPDFGVGSFHYEKQLKELGLDFTVRTKQLNGWCVYLYLDDWCILWYSTSDIWRNCIKILCLSSA